MSIRGILGIALLTLAFLTLLLFFIDSCLLPLLPENINNSILLLVALFVGVSGSFAALNDILELFHKLFSNHRVNVRVGFGRMYLINDVFQDMLEVIAVSVGEKPVTIVESGFILEPPPANESKIKAIWDRELPRELTHGHPHTSSIPRSEVPIEKVKYAYVRDALGRVWKSKKWPLSNKESGRLD